MNSSSLFSFANRHAEGLPRAVRLCAVVFVSALCAQAQPATTQGAVTVIGDQARADLRNLALSGQLAAAEKAIGDRSGFERNSEHWHLDTGRELVRLAADVGKTGKSAVAGNVARSALQHLEQAATLAKNDRTKASAKATAGYVNERYLGNTAAAIASYQAAVQLNPSDPAAKEHLDRLQNSYAILQTRLQAKKR